MKTIHYIVPVVIITLFVVLIVFNSDSETNDVETSELRSENTDPKKDFLIQRSSNSGIYTNFDANKLSSDTRNILFFSASWCITCEAAERHILANLEKIPSDIQILKLDYDSEKDLRNKYNISLQHSFVQVDENGNEINSWIGGDLDTIIEKAI